MERTAVYAGTFDILTYGHLHMIDEGCGLFDKLIVAIGNNPNKKTIFTLEERLSMLDACISAEEFIDGGKRTCLFYEKDITKIETATFDNMYLVDYCRERDAQFYLRGLRDEKDFAFEMGIVDINHESFAKRGRFAKPVWIPTDKRFRNISSSTVRNLIGPKGWEWIIRDFVPPPVFKKLLEKFNGEHPDEQYRRENPQDDEIE